MPVPQTHPAYGITPALKEKIIEANERASMWLAEGNTAAERGQFALAEKFYGRSQFWLDRLNRLEGNA